MQNNGRRTVQEAFDSLNDELRSMEGINTPSEFSDDSKRLGYSRDAHVQDNGIRLFIGRIVDTAPILNGYKVQVPNASTIACSCVCLSGGLLYAQPHYSVGDTVIGAMLRTTPGGVILGRLPGISKYGDYDLRSFITMSDSFKPDAFQKSLLGTLTDGDNYSCPAWTFGDAVRKTDIGELFIASPGGSKLFINPYMTYLAANDATGVWAFRDDSMLRVAGINYQGLTAGTSEIRLNDNGECIEYAGSSFHSWEQFGYFKKPSKVISDKSGWNNSPKAQSFKEPVNQNAKPFHPVQKFGGWIAQGIQNRILAPIKGSKFTNAGAIEKKQHGLASITEFSDGYIGIESAKGVSIVKRSFMPSVQMVLSPDSEEYGDNPDNYDFDHSDFKVYGEPEFNAGSCSKIMQAVMAIDDYSAYVCNYKPYAAFLNHKKDWYVPEESSVKKGNPSLKSAISRLMSNELASEPHSYTIEIENQKQKYYSTEAGLHFLPDGGIVLYDGYGSELRMSGGQITISAPGGIWLKSGKDVRIWGGKDINLRSKKSTDITSSKGSVRIKAEKNFEAIGGNEGGTSGVVIESRGRGDMDFSKGGDGVKVGGIVFRAADGTISTLANTVYVRSGVTSNGNGIMIDAGRGRANLYTASNNKSDYVNNRHVFNFGNFEAGTINAVQESSQYMATIPAMLDVGGFTTILGDVYVKDGVHAGDHFYSKRAKTDEHVNPIVKKAETAFDAHINKETNYVNTELPTTETSTYSSSVKPKFYESKKPGHTKVLEQAEFSFRTDDELNLKGFRVYADRWQTVCDVGSSWEEPKVTTATEKGQYPFPGKKYLKDENCYVTQELTLKENGTAKDRKEEKDGEVIDKYRKPKYKEPKLKPLSEMKVLD